MPAVVFTPAAQADVADAVSWYDERAPGLGQDLIGEIDSIVGRLAANPRQFPLAYKDARRALLRRFPYALFFRVTNARVQVIACFHTSRAPRRWRGRV